MNLISPIRIYKIIVMKIYILIIAVLFSIPRSYSQEKASTNRVHQAKVKFFTEKLGLNKEEFKKFWPVYNDYQSRKNRLVAERRNMMRFYTENHKNMSDSEISETLNRYIEIEKEETRLLETYNESFKRILPDEKVLKIYIVEVQFKNHLLKQLRTNTQSMQLRK